MHTPPFAVRAISQLAPPSLAESDWLWHGYLARGNVTLLTSVWKAGKTTLLAGLARALGSGTPFLGRPCTTASVLIVTEESERHWAARQRSIPNGANVQLVIRPFPKRPTPDQWDGLVRQAEGLRRDGKLDLLAVDPLASFIPGRSESDPATLLDLLTPLRRLADTGVAVLVLHHPRRERSAEGHTARGGGVLLGFVDVILELHPCGHLPSDANRRRLVGQSRLPDTPRQLAYEWTPGTPDFREVADPQLARFRDNWETVRTILAGREAPATHKELLADWPADWAANRPPLSPSQLYDWLSRAAAEGWVERTGSGTRSDPFRFRLPEGE